MDKNRRSLLITTGDTNGIGVEIAAKALRKIGPRLKSQAVVFLSQSGKKAFQKYCKTTKKISLEVSEDSPAVWVEKNATICLKSPNTHALVTGPLSKPVIDEVFPGVIGHTGILKNVSSAKNLFMGFVGTKFSVVLATGHVPVQEIQSTLDVKKLSAAIENARALRSKLPKVRSRLPIGILGLNPHAGDNGLIGSFEKDELIPFIRSINNSDLVGPLIPDVAFQNYDDYSVFVALYHDQGLIPFKLMHGKTGTHITLGLPFIRTSVDHGPALDIFGKGIANATSMADAILLADRLLGVKK